MSLQASKIFGDLQEEVDQLTAVETKQGINFSSRCLKVMGTEHYMKASSEKTVITFSSFTPFFPHLFLVHLTGLTEISFFRVQIQVRLNHCL